MTRLESENLTIPYSSNVECRVMTRDNKRRMREKFEEDLKHTNNKEDKTEIRKMQIINEGVKQTSNTINNVLKKLLNKENFTQEEQEQNEEVESQMRAKGIAPIGAYHFSTRSLLTDNINVDSYEKAIGDNVQPIDNIKGNDTILKQVHALKGLTTNAKVPYITSKGVDWFETGYGKVNEDSEILAKLLRPRRLTTNVLVSREMILNDGITNDFERVLMDAVQDKLVETIFSHSAEGTDGKSTPKGIFNGLSSTTISNTTDLINMQYEVDKEKVNGVWVLSPNAKKWVQTKSTNYPLFSNNTLLNSKAYFDSRVEDGYITYLDLSKLYVADWEVSSVTIDPITKSKDGLVAIYIDFYCDFKYLDDKFIKVGKIA